MSTDQRRAEAALLAVPAVWSLVGTWAMPALDMLCGNLRFNRPLAMLSTSTQLEFRFADGQPYSQFAPPGRLRNGQPDAHAAGPRWFTVHAKRWLAKRFSAWIDRNRRLAIDIEATIASAHAFLYAASAILLLRRPAR